MDVDKDFTTAQDLDESGKYKFQQMAETDKKRYEGDMQQYAAMGGTPLKRKQTKDPNAPKRALSGFFFFCSDERPRVRAVQPDWNVAEVAKELGRRWSTCPNKAKYEAQSKKDKERYERQMAEYKGKKPRTIQGPVNPVPVMMPRPVAVQNNDDDDEEDDDDEDEEEEDDEEDNE